MCQTFQVINNDKTVRQSDSSELSVVLSYDMVLRQNVRVLFLITMIYDRRMKVLKGNIFPKGIGHIKKINTVATMLSV